MKPNYPVQWLSVVLVTLLSFANFAQSAEKPIRLRNGSIQGHSQTNHTRANGLFLVQFKNAVSPQALDELRSQGIEPLKYVPDDAFICKLSNFLLDQLQSMPAIQYVGEYQPQHKLHPSLAKALKSKQAQADIAVSIVVSPSASATEKQAIRGAFRKVQQETHLRQGSVIRGTLPQNQLDQLSRSSVVLWLEPASKMKLNDEVSSRIVAGDGVPHTTYTQMNGYDGSGVAVAVADTGLDTGDPNTMHPDLFGRATNFFWYGSLTDASDEHSHGTHVSGIIAGNGAVGETDDNDMLYGLGVAPNASIIVQRIFDGAGNYEAPDSLGDLTRDAVQAGADIGSNSWGDDTKGVYNSDCMVFDGLVRDADDSTPGDQPYILEFSAGNAGPDYQTVDSPASAKNVIATGASESDRGDMLIYADGQDSMADFSSRGPCADGRIKPDVIAPGTWISSAFSSLAPEDNTWGAISGFYCWMGGTSQAGPHASGAAAVFVQYYRLIQNGSNPSPALVKAALINSAVDIGVGSTVAPNMDEGWGRIDLTGIIGSQRVCQFIDQTHRLTQGQIYEQHFLVGTHALPLKFTMAYTDVPGFPGAAAALVNDLDLEVIGPDGKHYHGNQFVDGESIPNPAGFDNLNNVEAVHLASPMPGDYVVRIFARRVVEDAIQATPGVIDQDFALVTSGELLGNSARLLVTNKRYYTVPGQIQITLYDAPLAGRSTVTAQISSTTEILGEALTLRAANTNGTFTNSIATVTGFAAQDGKLQIADGDALQVSCVDPMDNQTFTAAAIADLQPPEVQTVSARSRFGRAFVSWDTDEPASGIVRYGTNAQNLSLAVTNTIFENSQELDLPNLTPGTTYYFVVIATDQAGNTITNRDGTAPYSFVPAAAATVLLVDSYFNDIFDVPPLSGYTAALDQAGIDYEVWTAETDGYPEASDLRPFPLVIWRVPEFSLGTTLGVQQCAAITNYLNDGGSLLVASMELTSRLDESGASWFRADVLHVQNFTPDAGVPTVTGATNDAISSGMDMTLDYTAYVDESGFKDLMGITPDASDIIDEVSPGASPFLYSDDQMVGVRYPQPGVDAPGRVIYLSFALDALPLSGSPPNTRAQLLANMIAFLVPGINGQGTIALDRGSYTIPSIMNIEVADSDLKGQGQISIRAFSSTMPSGQAVRLTEGLRKGVFQGSITLVSATNPPASGQLRAGPNDVLWAEYFDASTQKTNRISAVVDLIPASVANVQATPEYVDAFITWDTSEAADSQVQFGKTKFLDRVAYVPDFSTYHEVFLDGLVPDQTYYYEVVSRDRAGNTTIDDNNGDLYTFTTDHPTYAPWSDNFDTGGAGDWSVYTSEDSDGLGWQLGVPNNGQESSAYSPPFAWGSNLNGDPINWVQTFLISSPIYITGGNKATLNFMHSYDFSERSSGDISEYGSIMILTNEYSDYITLGEVPMYDYSDSWEPVSLDLSPYVGQVVYLVFYYELITFNFDEVPNRPGWLIDNVAITVTNLIPGTLRITNNIWQANFDISGPSSVSGRGASLLITNAPPGQYIVTYHDVPYYQTPAAQTNTLTPSSTVVFTGSYTFADTNNNGISDAWEMQYFGSVSPTRTRSTDTDGDGASDYAEFIAGTDPRVASSSFKLTRFLPLNNGTIHLEWVSAKNRAYRIEGSTNARTWVPLTDWIQALSSTAYCTLPTPAPGGPYLFRVTVKP